jgi:DHA2 family multidrug resistance protein
MSATALPLPRTQAIDNKWLVTVAISFGALMATIDLSIVNVALPQIRGSIGASIDEMAAVATSFAIAQVIIMPLTAFVGRFFGQKSVYLFCLGLFLVGSILCGMAHSLVELVAARALQGLGAGALQPTQQAILRQTFPPEEQGMAMAMFVMVVVIGPAIGPTLGGWIVDNWSWPWIFYIKLPVGILGILMVTRFVHEPDDIRRANREAAAHARKNLDWQGIALMSVGFATLQYVLEQGPREDWFDSTLITVAVIVAAVSLIGFVVREFVARAPAVNLRLFRDPVFAAATAIGGVMFAILMANMFLMPVFMQELLGFTALQSGLALMPRSLAMMVATPLVGRLYNRTSPQLLVGLGVLCVALGSWQMGSFTLATGVEDVWWPLIVQGIGFSLLFVPLTTVALAQVQRQHISDASGLTAVVRQLGGSIGLAIFTTLLTQYIVTAQAGLAAHIDPTRPEVQQRMAMAQAAFMHRGMDAASAHAAAMRAMGGMVARQAQLIAFDKSFELGALLMVALLPLVFFLRHPKNHESEAGAAPHVEVEAT